MKSRIGNIVAGMLIAFVLVVGISAATAPAPAAQGSAFAVTTIGEIVAETVLASATTTVGPFIVSRCTSYGITIDQSGTGTFALNVVWLMADASTTILTEANVATSKGDGLSFEDSVHSGNVSFELEETGAANPITIDNAQLLCFTR